MLHFVQHDIKGRASDGWRWRPHEKHHRDFSIAIMRLTRNDRLLANVILEELSDEESRKPILTCLKVLQVAVILLIPVPST